MFSPLITAEFPTYDEAFGYTQAYAIENGIGLAKKRTNYREKGGPVRNQDLCCDRGSYQANRVAYQPAKEIGSSSVALHKQPVSTPLGSTASEYTASVYSASARNAGEPSRRDGG